MFLDFITNNTRLLIVNALYFMGKWKWQFDKEKTHNSTYFLDKNRETVVPTMYISGTFNYGYFEDLKARFIQIPYEVDNYSFFSFLFFLKISTINKSICNNSQNVDYKMSILIPEERDGLAKMEKKLKFFDHKYLRTHVYQKKIELYLPKFKIENTLDLNQSLTDVMYFMIDFNLIIIF